MKAVIKGAGYILAHAPDMVLHNGTTQTTERIVNPESEYLKELPNHIRSFDQVLSYWPNQVYIGNKTPDELTAVPQPWCDKTCDVSERYGRFGQMMPQEEFLLLMQACDVFDLVKLDKEPVREGYTFTGWYADKALTEPIDDIRMTANKTVYAGWERTGVPERLNGDDHFAYIIGRDDGLVHPEATITRAEVATIFFRLLTDEARAEYLTETSPFHDVAPDAWYATAVATMEVMGIVEGRAPAVFDPDAPITRGEFAAIAARFDSAPYDGADRFTDIGGHWAAEYINQAAVKGWVEGQPDGSFAPDRSISRAEAMTLVNRVLGRLPETADDLLDGMITWPDNPPGAWYYLAVQEATNSHDYGRKADTVHETWTGLQPVEDWTRYEQ